MAAGGSLRRVSLWALAAALGAAAAGGAGLLFLPSGGAPGADGQPPLIKAREGPVRVRPDAPGGMDIPNQNLDIFGQFEGREEPKVERLVPPPEAPRIDWAPRGDGAPRAAGAPAAPAGTPQVVIPPDRPAQTTPAAPPAQAPQAAAPADPAAAPPAAAPAEAPRAAPSPAEPAAPPKPAPPPAATTPPKATSPPPRPPPAFAIQLAALTSESAVRRSWAQLRKRHRDLLGRLSLKIERVVPKGGAQALYRMQAGPVATRQAARDLCARLKARKQACLVVGR